MAKRAIQYIQPVSRIPTMKFQDSLPRLPIPKLEDTLNKYIETVEPLLSETELQSTKKVVEDFRKVDGPKLHQQLVDHDNANKHTSYISAPWYEMYLSDRQPLPINYNPQITLMDDPNPQKNNQADRAALLISAALKFYNSLEDHVLEPDVFFTQPKTPAFDRCRFLPNSIAYYGAYFMKAYPLDMSQYSRLFFSSRIPKIGRDVLETKVSNHIVVLRKGHFYKVQVRNSSGGFSESEIRSSLAQIIADPSANNPSEGVGFLTTEQRDKWADVYTELYATNPATMDAINSAMFVLALDDKNPTSLEDYSKKFLLGEGSNRWYDKSFSILMSPEGKAAINFEHSWGDGVAVVRFLNEIFNDSLKQPIPSSQSNGQAPEKLSWNISPTITKAIEAAKKRYVEDGNSMNLKILTTDIINKNKIKELKVSPDGFLQMSFQLAYQKLFQKTVTTYESASTSGFKHGRTEAIRSATKESVVFTKAFTNSKSSLEEKSASLRKAIKKHSDITTEALMGKGIDRHLFGMRYLAQKKGQTLPAIFQDAAYKKLNHNILSTSTLASPAINLGGFGPVVRDGFGIGYGMDDNNLRFNVTSYMEVSPFLDKLKVSLEEMTHVLKTAPVPQESAPKKK